MQGLEALKRQLKDLVGEDKPDEAFRLLREDVLRSDGELYNELAIIQSNYRRAQREGNLNLIEYREKNLTFNSASHALLWVIDKMEVDDLGSRYRLKAGSRPALPDYHAYTIDRVEQSDQLQLNFFDTPGPEAKARFFYLYGDARQAHAELVKRASYDFGGQLLGWREQAPAAAPKLVVCKPPVNENPKLFYINLVREVLTQMGCPPAAQQPIGSRRLNEALANDKMRGLGPDDLVFVLLSIDDYNWRPRTTPVVVNDFIQQFCRCELPDSAPRFFFFFGLEYSKDNARVRQEVHEAVAQSDLIEALPELLPVGRDHIAEWFSRYRELLEDGLDAQAMAARLFPGADAIDMIDAVNQVKTIIDLYNRGFIRKI